VALLVAGEAKCDQSLFHGDSGVTFVDICVSLSNSISFPCVTLIEQWNLLDLLWIAILQQYPVVRSLKRCFVFRSARSDISLSICRSHDAYALQLQHSQPAANNQTSARSVRARVPLYYCIQFDSLGDFFFSAKLANGVQSINTPFAGRKTNSRRVSSCRACDHQTERSPEALTNGPKTVRMASYDFGTEVG
jgi:hypothetical protein